MFFLHIKSLPNLLFGVLCLPGEEALYLLGWFIGSRGFSSLEWRPKFWVLQVKAMVFSVVLYGCESWIIRTAECWRIDALELWYWRLLWIPCCKEVNPVNPNGNQCWIFTGRIDAEAETPILWPPDAKILMLGKTEHWTQEEKGTTKDHWCNGHKFEQTPGDSEGQGSLACCNWRGHQESDRTEWRNNNFPFNPE